jgi:hypothetical protein
MLVALSVTLGHPVSTRSSLVGSFAVAFIAGALLSAGLSLQKGGPLCAIVSVFFFTRQLFLHDGQLSFAVLGTETHCCVLCAVCCVLCAVCCVLCAVCCVLYLLI